MLARRCPRDPRDSYCCNGRAPPLFYIQRLCQDYRPGKHPLHVVWDPGHGATADVITALLPHLQGQHTLINGVIDGRFPAHHPR